MRLVASFIDEPGVAPAIIAAWVGLVGVIGMSGRGKQRALGITAVVGVFLLLVALAFTDWVIDDVF